jgi:hypothetical protein
MKREECDLPNELFSNSTANARAATIAIAGAPDGCLATVTASELVEAHL